MTAIWNSIILIDFHAKTSRQSISNKIHPVSRRLKYKTGNASAWFICSVIQWHSYLVNRAIQPRQWNETCATGITTDSIWYFVYLITTVNFHINNPVSLAAVQIVGSVVYISHTLSYGNESDFYYLRRCHLSVIRNVTVTNFWIPKNTIYFFWKCMFLHRYSLFFFANY
jgi:hypothetical protein